jgi:hypothetical protein
MGGELGWKHNNQENMGCDNENKNFVGEINKIFQCTWPDSPKVGKMAQHHNI